VGAVPVAVVDRGEGTERVGRPTGVGAGAGWVGTGGGPGAVTHHFHRVTAARLMTKAGGALLARAMSGSYAV
jgi:hypothetical protein